MHTAVVLSRPISVKWTRLSQTNVDVIDFLFLSSMNSSILWPLIHGSCYMLFFLVNFSSGARLTTAKVVYFQEENGYFLRHVL